MLGGVGTRKHTISDVASYIICCNLVGSKVKSVALKCQQWTFSEKFCVSTASHKEKATEKSTEMMLLKAGTNVYGRVMSDFVYWCRHLLVPFFFMK